MLFQAEVQRLAVKFLPEQQHLCRPSTSASVLQHQNTRGEGNFCGSGRSSSGGLHSSRPVEALSARQARTVGFVDTGGYRGQSLYHTSSSSSSSNHNDNNVMSKNDLKDSHTLSSLIPKCPVGVSSEECLSKVLRLVNTMLDVERDRRAAYEDAYYP
ncbi:hypothetical protein PoB_002985000 [Plakobranchus ocellatus]|uniref:Uncharacterized protein n=1 Tax=Plakobranchus ocellatus TaxID=259542 RepID=A0AAV4A966_9GAST|nr:hypothetical protein PoB_002985000 [Plakobranchus ocellatus]